MCVKTIGLVSAVLLISAAGCVVKEPPPPPQSPYVQGFRYAPEPALAVMLKQGTQTPSLSVMISVIGIRPRNPQTGLPAAVEVRMRFENAGQVPVGFDPHSASLVTGALQSFDQPDARPPAPLQIAPGQTQTQTLFFPFPPGTGSRNMALDSLRLRWQVKIENQPYLQTAYFERASQLYYGTE